MNLLNELLMLNESKEKNMLGLTIGGKKITEKTKDEKWAGYVSCFDNKLTSLEYCPSKIGGDFSCSWNNLTSLEYCPSEVGKHFSCSANKLKSLEHCPSEVGEDFICSINKLISLEHCPSEVGGNFGCSDNKLKDLHNIHKQLKKMNGIFHAHKNPIESSVLGLLLIPGCKKVTLGNKQVEEILNKYLPNTRGQRAVIECQSELIDANLEDYAHL